MSTNSLPAGQFLTTLSGKQCTARPQTRTSASLASVSSASVASVSAAASASSEASAQAASASSVAVAAAASAASIASASQAQATSTTAQLTSTSQAVVSVAATPVATTSFSSSEQATSTSAAVQITTSSISSASETTSSIISLSTTSAPPASTSIISATLSSSAAPIAQSDVSTSSKLSISSSSIVNGGLQSVVASTTAKQSAASTATPAAESSATTGISSTNATSTMPMVMGIVGGVALVGLLGCILWFFKRRRRNRDSFLTPLTTKDEKTFYEKDTESLGSSTRSDRWANQGDYQTEKFSGFKAKLLGLGASFRNKMPSRSNSPNVDLNRGNSQFMDGPIPQHSRSNSRFSTYETKVSPKERIAGWWSALPFNKNKRSQNEPSDPFASARSLNSINDLAARSTTGTPDFSQLLNTPERELQKQAQLRRDTLNNGGSLGLDFTSSLDPFADPQKAKNPFSDPVTQPSPTIPRSQTYIADIRRSRGQSVDLQSSGNNASAYAATNQAYNRPPSTTVASRYPSTMAPSRDSYRDTVFSNASFATNVRKGKGRSDPFDLERPELWAAKDAPAMPTSSMFDTLRGSAVPPPLGSGGPVPRIVSTATVTSKYSSGVSSLGGWGDPGPDVGSMSESGSLRDIDVEDGEARGMEAMLRREKERGGSPVSDVSSRFGVGKAR